MGINFKDEKIIIDTGRIKLDLDGTFPIGKEGILEDPAEDISEYKEWKIEGW